MLDKAKAFVKDHKEEIVVSTAVLTYGTLAFALGYKWPKTGSHRVKGASEVMINTTPALLIEFHDGRTQVLRQTPPK